MASEDGSHTNQSPTHECTTVLNAGMASEDGSQPVVLSARYQLPLCSTPGWRLRTVHGCGGRAVLVHPAVLNAGMASEDGSLSASRSSRSWSVLCSTPGWRLRTVHSASRSARSWSMLCSTPGWRLRTVHPRMSACRISSSRSAQRRDGV